TEMDARRRYGNKVPGFVEGDGDDPGSLYFRMDERPHRWNIVPGAEGALHGVGRQRASEAELGADKRRRDAAGVPWQEAPREVKKDRKVRGLITCTDPAGFTLEIYHTIALKHRRIPTPYGHQFVTGDQGAGHIVLSTPD